MSAINGFLKLFLRATSFGPDKFIKKKIWKVVKHPGEKSCFESYESFETRLMTTQ